MHLLCERHSPKHTRINENNQQTNLNTRIHATRKTMIITSLFNHNSSSKTENRSYQTCMFINNLGSSKNLAKTLHKNNIHHQSIQQSMHSNQNKVKKPKPSD